MLTDSCIYITPAPDRLKLKTMRADIDLRRLPKACRDALLRYDSIRDDPNYSWDKAETILNNSVYNKQSDLGRLARGLSAIPFRGLVLMARKYTHLCPVYISQNTGNLKTLQGLFYWNGSDEFTTRIILNAWKKNK